MKAELDSESSDSVQAAIIEAIEEINVRKELVINFRNDLLIEGLF